MKHLSSILTFLLLCGLLSAHSGKPRYHVVIDTDGALDDMRAITMFLAASDVRVLAITCSRGSLPARNTGRKVRSLLHTFHHEGIQVGTDTDLDTILPEWSSFANDVWWGKCQDVNPCDTFENATGLLKKVIHDYPYPVTLIALGSLETYAGLIRSDPEISDNIKRIIWYNEYITDRGYNYRISPESFAAIRRTGISLDIVTNKKRAWPVDQDYLSHINRARSIYARQIGSVFSQAPVLEKMHQQKLYLWDDLVPLYLTVPVLFETEGSGNLRYCYLNSQVPQAFVNEAIGKLLDSSNSPNNRVFSSFPLILPCISRHTAI